jgi:hypothetical protein
MDFGFTTLFDFASLAIGQGVSARRTAEPVRCGSVLIRGTAAMLRNMLPAGISAAVAATDIRVTVEIVVAINRGVYPNSSPTPNLHEAEALLERLYELSDGLSLHSVQSRDGLIVRRFRICFASCQLFHYIVGT